VRKWNGDDRFKKITDWMMDPQHRLRGPGLEAQMVHWRATRVAARTIQELRPAVDYPRRRDRLGQVVLAVGNDNYNKNFHEAYSVLNAGLGRSFLEQGMLRAVRIAEFCVL
jgi:hypothetical protein